MELPTTLTGTCCALFIGIRAAPVSLVLPNHAQD